MRQDNTIRIAYRRDAPPLSYQNGEEKPTGFIMDLCQAVAKRLSQRVNVPSLNVSYVPITNGSGVLSATIRRCRVPETSAIRQ